MAIRRLADYFLAFILALSLVACSLPAPTPLGSTPDISAQYTAAAETIMAQLTQAAGTVVVATPTSPAVTQLATATGAVQPTETLPAATATSTPETLTPTPTQEPSPTSPPPTPTSPPSDPRETLGNPQFRDRFASSDNWALYDDKHVSFEIVDDQLEMVAFNPDQWAGWVLTWPTISDFYLEMTAKPKKCSGLDQYGLVFRSEKDDKKGYIGYLYGVSCDGRYSLRFWDGDKFVKLIDWKSSDHLLAGSNQTNRLGVWAEGDRLTLYANGFKIDEVTDDTLDEGKFGVFVGAAKTEEFTAYTTDVSYWDLP